MKDILEKYLPQEAVEECFELIKSGHVYLKVVNRRKTRHGDYRKLPNGGHQITVNAMANKYKFLITLIHEMSHLFAFKEFGSSIKPHGKEWKYTFKKMMSPFLNESVFPKELLTYLKYHFENPKASSDTDIDLSLALRKYDQKEQGSCLLSEIKMGGVFRLHNGRVFRRGIKRIKRFECEEISTSRIYLFNPNAEVELVSNGVLNE